MKETSLPSAQLFCVIAVNRWARNSHRRAESPPEGAHLPKCDRWAVCPSHQRWPAEKPWASLPEPRPLLPVGRSSTNSSASAAGPRWPRSTSGTSLLTTPGVPPSPTATSSTGKQLADGKSQYGGAGGEKGINPILQPRWVPHLYDVFVSRSALGGVRDVDHGSVLLHGNHLDWHRHHSAREDGCVEDLCVLCAHTNTGCVSEELNTARMSQGSWQWQAQARDPPSHTPFKLPAMFQQLSKPKVASGPPSPGFDQRGFTLFEPIYRFGWGQCHL